MDLETNEENEKWAKERWVVEKKYHREDYKIFIFLRWYTTIICT